MIETQHLTKRYGTTVAVDGVSFDVQRGPGDRLCGPKRGRQVDHDAHDPGP